MNQLPFFLKKIETKQTTTQFLTKLSVSENNATAVCLCTFTSAKVTSRSDLTRSTHFSPWWCTSRDHFLYSISKGEKKRKGDHFLFTCVFWATKTMRITQSTKLTSHCHTSMVHIDVKFCTYFWISGPIVRGFHTEPT